MTGVQRIPWYIWCSVLAVTSAMVGAHWDISWHRSIGRDTFWTPAHMAIYLCGVLAGISCGFLILSTTFNPYSELRKSSVKLWGFRGPLGAFIASWGGLMMLTSAPFDDWWHSAYGLDVKIASPPHVVLIAGVLGVEVGTLILILGWMNRSDGLQRSRLERLFLYTGAMVLVILMVLTMEFTSRSLQHGPEMYQWVSIFVPVVLTGVAFASGRKWAATSVAAAYSLFLLAMVWILPLFPAEPKLGPVYVKVQQFVPPEFPLLLVAPAFVLDLLRVRKGWKSAWSTAVWCGSIFLAVLFVVQWPFADFLMSPAARNRWFGTIYFDYATRPTGYYARYLFYPTPYQGLLFWKEMAIAVVEAVLSARLGLAWGAWMQRIRR